jgi:dipeptidase
MRDHYEGTPFDMTRGVDAGPYGSPYRWRPLGWEVDNVKYGWERQISTQQTAFSFVSQSRDFMPDPVGGLLWYGFDDTYFTVYFPLYCGIEAIPESYTVGSDQKFTWESAWWVFNFVSNIANLKYSYMIEDIQKVQNELEGLSLALQPAVEKTALELFKTDQALMIRYLTDYSITRGEAAVERWRELGEELLVKYNDGYVKNHEGETEDKGYPENWLRKVNDARPGHFKLPDKRDDNPDIKLVD